MFDFSQPSIDTRFLTDSDKKNLRQSRVEQYVEKAVDYVDDDLIQIFHGNFQDICENIPSESVDHIITDPPYAREYLYLYSDLSSVASRILKPSGFCIAYTGKYDLPEVINRMGENLEYYWTIALIYTRGKKVFQKRMLDFYRPILIFQKLPVKRLKRFIPDIFKIYSKEKDLHEWQQPCNGVEWILDRFTEVGELILDPMAGSGTTAIACMRLNRKCIVIEKEEQSVGIIKARVMDERNHNDIWRKLKN